MQGPDHSRAGVVVAFIGGAAIGWGLLPTAPSWMPTWAWAVVGTLALMGGIFLAWPRPYDEERIEREVQERLLRERARNLGKDWAKAPERHGRASPTSKRFGGAGLGGADAQGAAQTDEAERVRREIRTVQRQIQEAGVRMGLKKLSKEGYTALVQDLQQKRAKLESRLIELERQAIERQ